MYVCNCNAIRQSDLCLAARNGVASAAEYFRRSGIEPQCGGCVADVQTAIEDAAPVPAE
jgi:bacterioferritin-associated ferredoxin